MSGKIVLDTNALIYHFQGLAPWTDFIDGQRRADVSVSVITRMELLALNGLAQDSERQIRAFLEKLNITPLSAAIENMAILLRRKARLKLPDAIVAATAVVSKAVLITNDKDMAALDWPDLKVMKPA